MNLTSIFDRENDPENNPVDRWLYDIERNTDAFIASLGLHPFAFAVILIAGVVLIGLIGYDIWRYRNYQSSLLAFIGGWVWNGLMSAWSFLKVLPVALKQRVAYRRRLKQAKADKRNQKAADVASSAVIIDEAEDEEIDLFAQLPIKTQLEIRLETALELMNNSLEIQNPEKQLADLHEATEKIEKCLDPESDFAPFFNQTTREEWNAIHDQGLEALRLLEQKHDTASTPS